MSAPTSPPTSPRNKSKLMDCRVLLLDDSIITYPIPIKSVGQDLYNKVVQKLELLEADYFDLQYTDVQGISCWLDHDKQILRQISRHSLDLRFVVKFYTPDPGLLEEEYTRYLFALQVKRDLLTGTMPCQEHTAVLLASYIVQAEFGDFMEGDENAVLSYLRNTKLLPKQNEALERKILEHHREHLGQSPAEAEFNLLDTARKVDLYGIQMHPAKDHETVPLHLAVAHMGILVFQNLTKINTFSWAKIRKLSFKRKKFLVKLHPDGYGYYKDTVEFYFESRNECKNFWKKCLEHHAFFRCHSVKRLPRNKTRVVSRGSSFRYSGRTQKQLIEHVRENFNKRPKFQRPSTSMRTVSMSHSAMATPKTGTLSSRDLHMGHHLSLSSGSRIINPERISMEEISRQNGKDTISHTEAHDRPTPSQSRSLQTFHLGDENKNQLPQANLVTSFDKEGNYDNLMKHRPSAELRTDVAVNKLDQAAKLDASNFMLTKDRNNSTPLFPVSEQTSEHGAAESVEIKLSRSPDMENIPEMIEDGGLGLPQYNRPGLQHSQSATVSDYSRLGQNLGLALVPPGGVDKLSPCLSPLIPRSSAFTNTQNDSFNMDMSFQEDQRKMMMPQEAVVELTDSRVAVPLPVSWKGNTVDAVEQSGVGGPVVFNVPKNKPDVTVTMGNGSIPSSSQQYFVSTAYYIAKELLMTERTYKKDLEIITVWFRNAMSHDDVLISNRPLDLLFRLFDPLYEFHCIFLKELEARLAAWESKSLLASSEYQQKIGDLFEKCLTALPRYQDVFEHQDEVLLELDAASHDNPVFEQLFKEFEMQKVCYLPLSTFLLKPYKRLLHYQLILNKFLKFYKPDHPDHDLCEEALCRYSEIIQHYRGKSRSFENLQKLVELQQDLIGIENLILPSREFIREGCLQKLSRKGYHQRMFFLFSDLLVYTSRSATRSLQFTVHGQLDITKMTIDETDPKIAVANSFSIYTGSHCLVVAASSEAEKTKWMEDLQMAIINARRYKNKELNVSYPSLKSNSSSEAAEETQDASKNPLTFDRPIQHRTNTLMHVCWHRNTSVSMKECSLATRNSLSGFLLRKFKNTSGWQKLWVAFTNFCLFFYKSYQDDFPLASLPLLGYSVQLPSSSDGIQKDFVFKLQFKNHIYFFRAESQYTFDRWMEAIHTATGNAQHIRIFSRMDSASATSPGLVDERNA